MRSRIGYLIWCCLFSSSVWAADKSPGLLGQWECQGEEGRMALEFGPHELVYGGEPGRYILRPGVIVVQGEYGPEEYRYTLKGDRLDVVFPLGERIRCQRAAASGKGSPARSAAGNPAQLRGRLCKYSGSSSSYSGSSYSSLAAAVFDGRGNMSYGSESSFSNQAGMGYGSSGGTRGTYRIVGEQVLIRLEDGSEVVAKINFRQRDGSISELMVDGKLWGAGLCE